jgi:hypothetical protein
LTGAFDAANIGGFSFSFYKGTQLVVNQMRAPGSVGGTFWLGDLPGDVWHRLNDRGDRLLPVWIKADGIDLDVMVGGGQNNAPVLNPTDVLPRIIRGM